jgi:hypothetical protein
VEDERMLILLIQQYAAKFGITFNSGVLDNEANKAKALVLLSQALSGQRGPVTDEDFS